MKIPVICNGRPRLLTAWLFGFSIALATLAASGQEDEAPAAPDAETKAKYEAFEKMLTGTRLVGSFTITGREDQKLQKEEYFIKRVRKLPEGDKWMFSARIKYGDKDYTVPLPIDVKWAGDTPMVTLTDFEILGQGPFSARVVFYDNKYAGTWSHGEVGGHLFGVIEPFEESNEE